MNNRVGIRELAMALVNKNKLSLKEAENFVATMFDTLNVGLNDDKQVKLKGLGTFKVMSVSARKSVDVNTGEPIIIDGRDKDLLYARQHHERFGEQALCPIRYGCYQRWC